MANRWTAEAALRADSFRSEQMRVEVASRHDCPTWRVYGGVAHNP